MNLNQLEALLAEMQADGRGVVFNSAADRSRLRRERKARGAWVEPAEVDADLVAGMLETEILAPEDIDDRRSRAVALGMALTELVQIRRREKNCVTRDGRPIRPV